MRKLRIKLQLISIIIFFLAYFLLLANSWAQATEATKPEVKGETKNDATSNDQNQKPLAPDVSLIGNLINSNLTSDSLLSKSITGLNSLNNSGPTAQEGATTKIINKASSVIIDAIGGKKPVSLIREFGISRNKLNSQTQAFFVKKIPVTMTSFNLWFISAKLICK